jgi:hypothetical protein
MKVLACAAVLIATALGTSACAGGQFQCDGLDCKSAVAHAPLPPSLRSFVLSTITSVSPDGGYDEIDVYGPGSRSALVKASSGDRVLESPSQAKQRFYLIVLHGQFSNCRSCNHPAGREPKHGTIETRVWSAADGTTDRGINRWLPAPISGIHRLATITFTGD